MNIKFYPMRPETDWSYVHGKLGILWVDDTRGILAIDVDSGTLVAGCILNNWTHSAVQVHFWIDNIFVLRHGFLEEVAKYALIDAGRDKLVGFVPGDNTEALRLDRHIGFTEMYRIKDGFKRGVDYVIMEADRAALARWLPKEDEDGIEESSKTA